MAITLTAPADPQDNDTLTWAQIAPAAGDLVILLWVNDGGDDQSGHADFARINANGGATVELGVYYRICTGSESANIFTSEAAFGVTGEEYCYHAIKIPAAEWHGETPPEISAIATASTGTPNPNAVAPSWSVSAAEAGTIFITTMCRDDADGITGAPTNYDTNFVRSEGGARGPEIGTSWRIPSPAVQSENPGDWSVTGTAEEYITHTIAVRGPILVATISPAGFADTDLFGTATIGTVAVFADAFAQTDAFGTPKHLLALAVAGHVDADAFGTPAQAFLPEPAGFADEDLFGTATIGTVAVFADAFAETDAFGTPTLRSLLQATGHADEDLFGEPTFATTRVYATGFADADLFGSPTERLALASTGHADEDLFGTATIAAVGETLEADSFVEVDAFGSSAVARILAPAAFVETDLFGQARLRLTVAAAAFADADMYGGAVLQLSLDATGHADADMYGVPAIPQYVAVRPDAVVEADLFGSTKVLSGHRIISQRAVVGVIGTGSRDRQLIRIVASGDQPATMRVLFRLDYRPLPFRSTADQSLRRLLRQSLYVRGEHGILSYYEARALIAAGAAAAA